jgi:hypothetical protein
MDISQAVAFSKFLLPVAGSWMSKYTNVWRNTDITSSLAGFDADNAVFVPVTYRSQRGCKTRPAASTATNGKEEGSLRDPGKIREAFV